MQNIGGNQTSTQYGLQTLPPAVDMSTPAAYVSATGNLNRPLLVTLTVTAAALNWAFPSDPINPGPLFVLLENGPTSQRLDAAPFNSVRTFRVTAKGAGTIGDKLVLAETVAGYDALGMVRSTATLYNKATGSHNYSTSAYSVTGLTAGDLVYVTFGANEVSCTNGTATLTASGFIRVPANGTLVFAGNGASAAVSFTIGSGAWHVVAIARETFVDGQQVLVQVHTGETVTYAGTAS